MLALAVPFAMAVARPVYRAIYDPLLDHFWRHQAAALAGCALMLVPPAALMGATLPVLCRFYVRRLDQLGRRTGWLYGLNTAGAALGVTLCGPGLHPFPGGVADPGAFRRVEFPDRGRLPMGLPGGYRPKRRQKKTDRSTTQHRSKCCRSTRSQKA